MIARDYNLINFKDIFIYDENSPSCVSKKVKNGITPTGFITGIENNAYWGVSIKQIKYFAHRVVWVLKYGFIDQDMSIDHIDGNRLNNNIDNLRVVSKVENMRNLAMYRNNSSGFAGVSLIKRKYGDFVKEFWIAQWYDLDGNHHNKWFSVSKYGFDGAFKLAFDFRKDVISNLNMQGAGYTDRHGTKED